MILLWILLALVSLFFTAVAGITLAWMLYAWRTPEHVARTRFPAHREPMHSFSLMVPARHEQAVLKSTLNRLLQTTHPRVEILAIVGHDDPETAQVAHEVAQNDPRVRVITDHNWPKNKPLGLNTALPHCTGDIIGVFDAEDDVAPDLLVRADAAFQESGAAVLQCGVQLMNFWSSWYSVRNVLEYYFWFRSRLHFHAAMRFIPLGGNTVFFSAEVLRETEGWDASCLAEDCEVGVRLSTAGHTVAVAYEPALATREETPESISAFIKQRTRWNQGYLQVLKKDDWKQIGPWWRKALALYTLTTPFMQAFSAVMVPVSLVAALTLKAPVGLALFTFLPLIPLAMTVVVELVGLREFSREFELKARPRDYARLVIGAPLYQFLLAVAAVRAVWREFRGQRGWEKTLHVGAHLGTEPASA